MAAAYYCFGGTMKESLKSFILVILSIILFVTSFSFNALDTKAANKPVVIVIDPGHGGVGEKNTGAIYNGLTEKDLTLKVANAMKTELEKFENVTVYLTHVKDEFMPLEDRAEFAKKVAADFVYSIHFNASAEHSFYGSEVWCSAFGKYYQQGFDFGLLASNELATLGLYQKGVKTKIGKTGQDYYGIIRHCQARGIPCDIIEHCYLDHAYDAKILKENTYDVYTALGVCDATAVAKYFNLKSKDGTKDYTNFKYYNVKKPSGKVRQDTTAPDKCSIKVLGYDSASRNALVELTASDAQSPVIFFSFSYDGGNTFCPLGMWDRTKTTQSFNINIPKALTEAGIVVRAYNSYELYSTSNEVKIETR